MSRQQEKSRVKQERDMTYQEKWDANQVIIDEQQKIIDDCNRQLNTQVFPVLCILGIMWFLFSVFAVIVTG